MKLGILLSLFLVFSSAVNAEETESTISTAAPTEQEQVAAQPAVEAEKSEEQIPVNFNKEKKSAAAEASSGRMFLTFGLMAIVLGVGYYYAKKHGKPSNSPQTKIKILTQHYLGPKKSLAIVRVAGESILIGITDQNINMLKSLSLLDDEIPESLSGTSFQETLHVNEKKEMSVERNQSGLMSKENSGEEFSIRHIKDVVSLKLKGMRGDI